MRSTSINRLAAAILVCAAAAALVWWGPWRGPQDGDHVLGINASALERRRADLGLQLAVFKPGISLPVNDLAAPLASILQRCPGIGRVDMSLVKPTPHRRVVHFLDWHFVERDLLAKVDGRTDWQTFLHEVELIQLEQSTALECLVRHHGLTTVLVEGLTPADMPMLPDKLAHLRETGMLKDQLTETRRLLRDFPKGSDRHKKAHALEMEISAMLAGDREDTLKMGAAIQLLASGRLEAVLPLDDAKLLDAAGPGLPAAQRDAAAVARREQAMARNALAAGPVAVITCGAAHDLSAAIREADTQAEYYRVATCAFAAMRKDH